MLCRVVVENSRPIERATRYLVAEFDKQASPPSDKTLTRSSSYQAESVPKRDRHPQLQVAQESEGTRGVSKGGA